MVAPSVRVLMRWDARRLETADVTPLGAAAAIVLWEGFPGVEGGVPNRLCRPLARALTMLGETCFRAGGPPPANARVLGEVKASRLPFARRWTLVGTRDPAAAMSLFEFGWDQGDGVAMVAPLDDARATAMLGASRIDGVALADAEVVVAAIVDGAGMLVAAPDRDRLERAIGVIVQQCADEGIPASA